MAYWELQREEEEKRRVASEVSSSLRARDSYILMRLSSRHRERELWLGGVGLRQRPARK